jgi:short-subunit dehydrogenase
MAKTIVVAGHGPGISRAVAERFAQAGFQAALIARNAERLAAGVRELEQKGIVARAFPADLGDADRARAVVARVRKELGPIDAIAWVAYSTAAGDALAAPAAEVRSALEIATASLLAAVHEALPDLRERKGAVLVTNGGFGLCDERIDAVCVDTQAMGLAMANAAKHKLVGMLAHRLRREGVYVGEVMVMGTVKGTAFDRGGPGLEPSTIASRFWDLYSARSPTFVQVG